MASSIGLRVKFQVLGYWVTAIRFWGKCYWLWFWSRGYYWVMVMVRAGVTARVRFRAGIRVRVWVRV